MNLPDYSHQHVPIRSQVEQLQLLLSEQDDSGTAARAKLCYRSLRYGFDPLR